MFQLDREISRWLEAALPAGCDRRAVRAELEDHLRSEIEALRASGAGDEEAFRAAMQRMGDPADLARELASGRGLLGVLCTTPMEPSDEEANVNNNSRGFQMRLAAVVLLQSAVWAAVMVATAAALADTGTYADVSSWLVAGWFATTMLPLMLIDLRAAARSEWQCLRRRFPGGS